MGDDGHLSKFTSGNRLGLPGQSFSSYPFAGGSPHTPVERITPCKTGHLEVLNGKLAFCPGYLWLRTVLGVCSTLVYVFLLCVSHMFLPGDSFELQW